VLLDAINRRTDRQLKRLDGRGFIYVPLSLPPRPIEGVFEREFINVDLGPGIDGTNPFFVCAASEIEAGAHGDQLVVSNADLDGTPGQTTFNVVSRQPDGTGLITLELEEQ